MSATAKAKAYLSTLSPHVRDRKAASVIRELVAEIESRDELEALSDKLSDLLRRTAVTLKGPEPDLTAWDWSDLAERDQAQRDLIVRAINGAIGKHIHEVLEGRAAPRQIWCLVKSVFGRGSTVSADICRQYGFAPDREIGADE